MPLSREDLVSGYVSAMRHGDAALFVGAGMSRTSGFVDWKGLLARCAQEIGLDINLEHDLVAVAQYYLNRNRNRAQLNQILRSEFAKPGELTESHRIIGQMPIHTVWTTNFDRLLEGAYQEAGKAVDVKSRDSQIPRANYGRRDVTLYKMHGDIDDPNEVIICKDDYECYARRHELFQNQLAAELISKTFLFIGFSFTDPNLDYVLGHLRSLLLEHDRRPHYAIMRRVRQNDHHPDQSEAKKRSQYEQIKQELKIENLSRYSIQTHLIDRFDEVSVILRQIQARYYQQNVFISGGVYDFGDFSEDRGKQLWIGLAQRLIAKKYHLVSGVGLGIDHSSPGVGAESFSRKYREDMIASCGFAIFIAGKPRQHHESIGVIEEYEIARKLKKIPIPIGATGFAAQRIWELVLNDIEETYRGAVSLTTYQRLNDPTQSNDLLLDTVIEIMEAIACEKTPGTTGPRNEAWKRIPPQSDRRPHGLEKATI